MVKKEKACVPNVYVYFVVALAIFLPCLSLVSFSTS